MLLCSCIIDILYSFTGGDCECLCTVVAAYAHQCAMSGVSIKWRSPDFCGKIYLYTVYKRGYKGRGSTRPEVRSAPYESSRPWVNSALSQLGPVYFQSVQLHTCTCIIQFGFRIIFRTRSKINIKKNIDKHCY